MDSYFFAEPEPGCTYIPLRGISTSRSSALAQTVANAYGMSSSPITVTLTISTDAIAIANAVIRIKPPDDPDDGAAGVLART